MRRLLRLAPPALLAVALLGGCGYSDPTASAPVVGTNANPKQAAQAAGDDFHAGDGMKPVTIPGGLKYVDYKLGSGQVAASGESVTMQYTGWLTDGTKFDSSRDSGQPFTVTIGQGQVIKGWDLGIPGMRVGGKRKLTIPPDLAYGSQGQGPIPANATLVFDVELVSVNGTPTPSPAGSPSPTHS